MPRNCCSSCWYQWPATKNLPQNVQVAPELQKPKAIAYEECTALGRCRAGWLLEGYLCVEWGGVPGRQEVEWLTSLSQCSFRIGCVQEGFNIGKMVPICRLLWRGPKKGAMDAVPSVLTLVPYNSVFPCMSLVSPKLLTFCRRPG